MVRCDGGCNQYKHAQADLYHKIREKKPVLKPADYSYSLTSLATAGTNFGHKPWCAGFGVVRHEHRVWPIVVSLCCWRIRPQCRRRTCKYRHQSVADALTSRRRFSPARCSPQMWRSKRKQHLNSLVLRAHLSVLFHGLCLARHRLVVHSWARRSVITLVLLASLEAGNLKIDSYLDSKVI